MKTTFNIEPTIKPKISNSTASMRDSKNQRETLVVTRG